jgi:4-hydroxybenzoyl-CoA thioesterase
MPDQQPIVAGAFSMPVTVRFGDCDPAGIVFYPRYFEMFNNLVEEWCAAGLGSSFRNLVIERGLGLPAVSIQTDFIATSTLGDKLTAQLSVLKIGSSSLTLAVLLMGEGGDVRVRATMVVVLIDIKKASAVRIPDPMRERIAPFCAPQEQTNEVRN